MENRSRPVKKTMKTKWWIKLIFVSVVIALWLPILVPITYAGFMKWAYSRTSPMYQMRGHSSIEFVKRFGVPLSITREGTWEIWRYDPWPKLVRLSNVRVYVESGRVTAVVNPFD
jgi:hypothetical protein